MGLEIVYCFRCDQRLTGADIENAKAVRASNKVCCVKCLTPSEKKQFERIRQARTRKSTPPATPRIQRQLAPATPTGTRKADAPPKSGKASRTLILGGIAGAGLLLAVLLLVSPTGGGPLQPTAQHPDPAPPKSLTRQQKAERSLKQARAFAQANPELLDEQKERYDRISWNYEGTPAAAEALRASHEIDERIVLGYAGEIDTLKEKLEEPLRTGEFRVAQTIIDLSKGRHAHPQWNLSIDRMHRDLNARAKTRLEELIGKAAQSAERKDYDAIHRIRDEISRWGPTFHRLLERFDARFAGILADAPTRAVSVTLLAPSSNARLTAGDDVPFQVRVSGSVHRVEYVTAGAVLASVTAPPFAFTWSDAPQGEHSITVTAYDRDGRHGEPAQIVLRIGERPDPSILVKRGATWAYLDDGSDQGTAWRAPGFDDRAWKRGPAVLGYGESNVRTAVSFGRDPDNKHVTTYFRRAFEVASLETVPTLVLRLMRDDGAVVYLNGKEVVRSDMPAYPVHFRTMSLGVLAREKQYLEFQVDRTNLVRGRNVLAVEIHQSSGSSSDITFDLELVAGGQARLTPEPVVRDTHVPPDCEVLWKRTWYPAKVLKKEGENRWYIHYVGDSDEDDEWVGKDRIRFDTK